MSITIDGELNTISKNGTILNFNNFSVEIPTGNTLQRPSIPVSGMIRFNTDTKRVEGYDGTLWINIQQ